MNLRKLYENHNYSIDDAVNFHKELNPQLFINEKMRQEVRKALLDIAEDFKTFIGITDPACVDITVSGSNAAYTYTPHSDIDLHLIVDFTQLSDDEVYRELFAAKVYAYNDQHDITVKSYDVEVYVQDQDQPHSSLGVYSVQDDEWISVPTMERANIDDNATAAKYEKLRQLVILALASDSLEYVENVFDVIKRYRRAGLSSGGEFSPENLAFKTLRAKNLIQKLADKRAKLRDQELSLESANLNEAQKLYREYSKQLRQMFESESHDRASRLGYRMNDPLYHWTHSNITRFRPSTKGKYGPGIYLSRNKDYGKKYVKRGEGNLIEVFTNANIASPDVVKDAFTEAQAELQKMQDAIRERGLNAAAVNQVQWRIVNKILQDRGYHGLEFSSSGREAESEVVIFDPKRLKTRSAKFDDASVETDNIHEAANEINQ